MCHLRHVCIMYMCYIHLYAYIPGFTAARTVREPLLSLSLILFEVKKRFLLLFPMLINVMLYPDLPVVS